MLGQLINSLNPGKRLLQRVPQLDSDIEEAHTKSLLFPDAATLQQTSAFSDLLPGDVTISAASLLAEIDTGLSDLALENPRDIRVIVAQNAKWSQEETVLYDSWNNPKPDTQTVLAASPHITDRTQKVPATAPASRRSSVTSQDGGRRSPSSLSSGGAFQRNRLRNISLSTPLPFIDETSQARHREAEDMVKQALECMFENAQSSYKGTSTRIHTIPLDAKPHETVLTSPTFAESSSSLGRASGQRRSLLAKSYTPNDASSFQLGPDDLRTPRTPGTDARRRTVLISRMFPVHLVEEREDSSGVLEQDGPTPTPSNPAPSGGYPFPSSGGGIKSTSSTSQGKSHALPMYGISIIVQLPLASGHGGPRRNRSGYFPPMPQGASSESFSSSYGSEDRTGSWSFVDSVFGMESILSNSLNAEVDDRMDMIGQHWDIISRSLTALQILVQGQIAGALKVQIRTPRLQLAPYALATDSTLHIAADAAARRIVRGIKLPRVRTGQQRWGIWREEAKWVAKWAGGHEQNEFLFNVMTTFLGQHTDWMRIFGPKWHRKRLAQLRKSRSSDDVTIPSRTVIIAKPETKMAARRLIFLLAAFLPANKPIFDSGTPARPDTAASLRTYSRSPPGGGVVNRQESLRKTINRRGQIPNTFRTTQSLNRNVQDVHLETPYETATPDQESSADDRTRLRRGSDARSILRAPLAVGTDDENMLRKVSTTTVSTVTPDLAPAAHFAIQRANSATDFRMSHHRPGSSGSLASANLMSTLQRDNTGSSVGSQIASSRWGSLRSLWSLGSRQDSATDHSDTLQATDEGFGILSSNNSRLQQSRSTNKLEQMVREGEALIQGDFGVQQESQAAHRSGHATFDVAQHQATSKATPPSEVRPIPERLVQSDSPFKMSVSEKDGVIDVEIPFPDFTGSPPVHLRSMFSPQHGSHAHRTEHHHSSSFASTASNSPKFSLPPSLVHSFASLTPPGDPFFTGLPADDLHPLNIGGCLQEFHPDFTLQAILFAPPNYNTDSDWLREIKAAMRTEPSPPLTDPATGLDNGPHDRWVKVANTTIADTRSWTVKSLSLRRLVRYVDMSTQPAVTPAVTPGGGAYSFNSKLPNSSASPKRSRYGNPYDKLIYGRPGGDDVYTVPMINEVVLKEEWDEEVIQNIDHALVESFQRAVGLFSNDSDSITIHDLASKTPVHSRTPSVSSSQGSSRPGRLAADIAPLTASIHSETSQPAARPEHIISSGGTLSDSARECRDTMFAFLEAVVKDVIDTRQAQAQEISERGPVVLVEGDHINKSSLREGVKKWLLEVENAVK